MAFLCFVFQEEDGIRYAQESRGLADVYKRQLLIESSSRRQKKAIRRNQEPLPRDYLKVG